MATKKIKTIKKSVGKTIAKKSKKPAKTIKAKVALARININIPKSLHNKTKQFSLKNKITIQEIVSAAIKEYINKPAMLGTVPDTKSAVWFNFKKLN